MKVVSVFFLCSTLVFALPFKLNTKDILTIQKAYEGKKITTRLLRYKAFLKQAQYFHLEKKLNRVNAYINKIRPKLDKTSNQDGKESTIGDYWMTPKEFFITGSGDCEDYAIAKFYTLQYLGIDSKHLYLSVVKVKGSSSFHMVLLYLKDKNSIPLVLDNLSWKVLFLTQRKDLTPLVAFNEIEARGFKNGKLDKKVKIDWGKEDKWKNFLERLNQN